MRLITDIESRYRKATKCRECFENREVEAPRVLDIAQPRLIGSNYFSAPIRVVVVMLNPGSGDNRLDDADKTARGLLHSFSSKKDKTLDKFFAHQMEDMEKWGRGKFIPFYTEKLGLDLENIAFANLALCGTKGNHYPSQLLNNCFEKHTKEILRELEPDILLLSGSAAQPFKARLEDIVPKDCIITMPHFAHRMGDEEENRLLKETSKQIRQCQKRISKS